MDIYYKDGFIAERCFKKHFSQSTKVSLKNPIAMKTVMKIFTTLYSTQPYMATHNKTRQTATCKIVFIAKLIFVNYITDDLYCYET